MKRANQDSDPASNASSSSSSNNASAANISSTAARVIKIAEPPHPPPHAPPPQPQTVITTGGGGGAAAAIFPTRPLGLEMPPQNATPTGANSQGATQPTTTFTRVITPGNAQPTTGNVSVYRGESGSVAITPTGPPTNLQPNPQTSSLTGVQVLTHSMIKPEPIALPTTPVSVQYNTFASSTVKTLSGAGNNSAASASAAASHAIVQNLQQQQQQQNAAHQHQIVQNKMGHSSVSFNPTGGLRNATLPTVPNPQTGPPINVVTSVGAVSVSQAPPLTVSGAAVSVAAPTSNNTQFQRLKVEDALSYLDQVKYKFGNQPQVYNDFLDIMKEFKSQSIDTPGVIQRVSNLFKGHPELIVGFNTFLPPGYKIEVTCNDVSLAQVPGINMGSSGIMQTIVHTPTGIHTVAPQGNMAPMAPVQQQQQQAPPSAATMRPLPTVQPQFSQQQQPPTQQPPIQPPPQVQTTASKFAPASVTATAVAASKQPEPLQPPKTVATASLQLPTQPTTPHLPNAAAQAYLHTTTQQPLTIQHGRGVIETHNHHIIGGPNSGDFHPSGQQHQQQQPPKQPPQQQIQQQQQQQPVVVQTQPPAPVPTANTQPEFNHAINYVNKIKSRFSGQPDVYKSFLEILHAYQKDQKAIKDGLPPNPNHLTETEVYAKVSKLFRNQEDLLNEFGQFLPEAGDAHAQLGSGGGASAANLGGGPLTNKVKKPGNIAGGTANVYPNRFDPHLGNTGPKYPGGIIPGTNKRPPSGISHPPAKKPKVGVGALKDVSLAEASKLGTLNEFAFFDKVRKALRSKDVYENFLRCLVLFNQEVISRAELIQLSSSFLTRHPELFKYFKDFVGVKESDRHGGAGQSAGHHLGGEGGGGPSSGVIQQPIMPPGRERLSGDSAQEIDYATCKRLGASYCALPDNFVQPECSGRKKMTLCKEVLNDTWVSFPSWSEDSQFVTSRKTTFEECIYRTEDERFEFDVVLETNKDTIKVLETVQKKMSRMIPEEAARYKLDECLGGNSPTIHQRAIKRIYGDKAGDIIEGLRKNPVIAVPVVLKRLKAKDEEWREVQKSFNKVWREQNEKFYLKSLDHQGIMFKQSDSRLIRSKAIMNEIENFYDERHEQEETNEGEPLAGPHVTVDYPDSSILLDANNLIIHHIKRQTTVGNVEKQKVKVLLRHYLLDFFQHQRQELSDDEREDDEDEDEDESDKDREAKENGGSKATRSERARKKRDDKKDKDKDQKREKEITEADIKVEPNKDGRSTPLHARNMDPDERYTMKVVNSNWYIFFRLHNLLCTRLSTIYDQSVTLVSEEKKDKATRKEAVSIALRLKPKRLYLSRYGPYYRRNRGNNNHQYFGGGSEHFSHLFTSPTSNTTAAAATNGAETSGIISSAPTEIEVEDYYPTFLEMVKNVLDGNLEPVNFEDQLREMFGIHAYITFNMDKLVMNICRQLNAIVSEIMCVGCQELFVSEKANGATGGTCGTAIDRVTKETLYIKRAEKLLENDNCIKIILFHQSQKMTFEMLDTETDNSSDDENGGNGGGSGSGAATAETNSGGNPVEANEAIGKKFNDYVEKFLSPGDNVSLEFKATFRKKPCFLPRGIRSYKNSSFGNVRMENSLPPALHGIVKPEFDLVEDGKSGENKTDKSKNNSAAGDDTSKNEANEMHDSAGSSNKSTASKAQLHPSKRARLHGSSTNGVINEDNIHCRFGANNKIMYVINSTSIFFRSGSLKRAKESHKEVSRRKHSSFQRFHSVWAEQNVSESQRKDANDWFMGHCEGLVAHETTKIASSDHQNKKPFRQYHKYRVTVQPSPASGKL